MRLARVRWRVKDEEFEVVGHGRLWFGERDGIAGSVEIVEVDGHAGRGFERGDRHDLLVAGRSDLLVGQPESDWLECKGRPYRLRESLERFELAKDIAMLANRPKGGVLLIGPATKTNKGLDVIRKVVPQALGDIRPASCHGAIRRTVFPPPQDLKIEAIASGTDGGILFIEVPPQPQALLPFLVIGAIAEDKVLGNHFSLVYRRGDKGVAIKPEEVHGLLIAGRAALSDGGPGEGGRPPSEEEDGGR